jgi:hypothetical protein
MATPTKKMYDRKGKLIFDPNNPEDVRRQEEINKQIEMAKELFSIVDPRGGGGLGAMARGISKAALAKMAKSKFTQNRAKQLTDLVTKPMTRGKKAVTKKAIPTVKEIVETKPTISTNIPTSGTTVPDRIKSLNNAEIKAFETVKNIRELAEKQVKNVPTTAPIKEMWKKPLPTPSYTEDGFRIGGTEAKSILSKLKDSEAARNATKKAFEKGNAEIIKKGVEKTNTNAASLGVLAGVLGAGAETIAYGMRLSNKDNKQTTGPVDLKRINTSKLKPSKVEGVYITSALVDGKMKDFGIKWNNSTSKWEYYKGDGKPVVKQTTPKQETVKDNTGGGGSAPIDNNNQNKGTGTGGGGNQTTTTGGGGGTKTPVKPTVTTTPLMGDEEYKKDPRLATLRQQDDDRQLLARAEAQKKEMMEFKPTEVLPTKPLSSLVFKTSPTVTANNLKRDELDEQSALYSIKGDNLIRNKLPLKKKRYGGNLAMLKYMK